MVSDIVLGAVVGVGGTVVGSIVTGGISWLNTRQRIEAENLRHKAEFYVGHKVERIVDLYNAVEELHYTFSDPDPYADYGLDDFQSAIQDYEKALRRANIYLTLEERGTLYEYLRNHEKAEQVLREAPSADGMTIEEFEQLSSEFEDTELDDIDFEKWAEAQTMSERIDLVDSEIDWEALVGGTEEVMEILEDKLSEPVRQFEE